MVLLFYLICSLFLSSACSAENSLPWHAQRYNRDAQRQNGIAQKIVAEYEFAPDKKILDIGCGAGKISTLLAEKVPYGSVIGIDISSSMIKFAQEHYAHIPNVSFMQHDATDLAFQDEFDYVTSFFCLHWIQDIKTALAQIVRALKPGGSLLFIATIDDEQPIVTAYKAALLSSRWSDHFKQYAFPLHLINPKQCKKELAKLGCSEITYQCIKKFNIFSSCAQFKKHLQALPIGIEILNESLHNEFLDTVIDEYLKLYPENENGSINYLCPYAIIQAKKMADD
ncbi:MAG: trans-aconitate 2-methyltransferase [Candidatus Babeliales bacterium]